MSKIARYQGNLRAFASNAEGVERTLFGETAQADDLTSQVTAAFLRGWGIVGASEHPSLEDFNGAMFAMTQFLAYQHQVGVPEWHAQQEYYVGSICSHKGESYQSLIDGNVGNEPPSIRWTPILTSKNGLQNLKINDAAYGVKGVAVLNTIGTSLWTVPDVLKNGRKAKVTVIGGGGSGGRAAGGGGGGGGGFCTKVLDLTGISTVPVTVGAGGIAPAAGTSMQGGTNGGTSSFGTYCSATGGTGGGTPSAAYGGKGVGGDLNLGLGPGSAGASYGTNYYNSGSGGGAGGAGTSSGTQADGNSATSYGGGGAGAAAGSPAVSCMAGDGYQGIVIVEW
ncbi:hypothetical protein [Kluyvera intermedia]|uniref:glycine-rich domain-containing protein n=1 Tax=Kluyvera intermedia TaxID=61648 RepID=UPI003B9F1746